MGREWMISDLNHFYASEEYSRHTRKIKNVVYLMRH
jgi:hypothetical protein